MAWCCVFGTALIVSYPLQASLLVNGDFESGDKEWSGWAKTKDVMRVVSRDAHGGSRAAQMTVSNGNVATWSQRLSAIPRGAYRLSGWVRTESASSVSIKLESDTGSLGACPIVSGTHIWKRITADIDISKDTRAVVRCIIMKEGTAWFDDITLAPAGSDTISLEGHWRFAPGDDAARASERLDDSAWKQIRVPALWENEGYPDVEGFAWYRRTVTIPETWRGRTLVLRIGGVSKADEAYMNGDIIGSTGAFPPAFKDATAAPREYVLAPERIRFGAENSIAIRVFDGNDGRRGGIMKAPVTVEPVSGAMITLTKRIPTTVIVRGGTIALDAGVRIADRHDGLTFVCALRDHRGREISAIRQTLAPGSTSANVPIVFTPETEGYFICDARLENGHEELAAASLTAAVMPPVSPSRNNFGVVAHLKRLPPEELSLRLDILSRMGANWVREGFLWDMIEPSEGDLRWERFDTIIAETAKRSVRVLPIAAYGTAWASTAGPEVSPADRKSAMPRIDAWERYIAAMVERYKRSCPVWEIWNEPNGLGFWKPYPDAASYAALLSSAHAVIKRVDPSLSVMIAGFSPKYWVVDHPKTHEALFVKALYERTPRPFDIAAYHPYTAPATETSNRAVVDKLVFMPSSIRDVLRANGDENVPMWFTEMGTPTRSFMTKERAAEYLVLLYVKALSLPNIGTCFWYDLVDDGTDPNDSEQNFGLLHADYTPKQGYVAYAVLVRMLGNAVFMRDEYRSGASFYHFKRGTIAVIAAWADGPAAVSCPLPRQDSPARITDHMGIIIAGSARGVYAVGESPVYIEYDE